MNETAPDSLRRSWGSRRQTQTRPDNERKRRRKWLVKRLKKLDLKLTAAGNPAMKIPMMGAHVGLPNILTAIPGVDAACSTMMKNLMNKKGVASIEELRELAVDAEVRMIACQMTMDLFEYSLDDMIDGIELGGAATYIDCATQSDINLFI